MPIFDEPNFRFATTLYDPAEDPLFLAEYKATGRWPEEFFRYKQQIADELQMDTNLEIPQYSSKWKALTWRVIDPLGWKNMVQS